MSRIGRLPIKLEDGVSVKFEGGVVTASGKLGTLSQKIASKDIVVEIGEQVEVKRLNEQKQTKALHGLYRALINNMVVGVSKGFTKTLVVKGVGYKTQVSGKKLVMNLGLSHQIEYAVPEGIEITCTSPLEIVIKGISKEAVGHVAAAIKAKRPIEPYHGYGIRYKDEVVVIKEGKTAGK